LRCTRRYIVNWFGKPTPVGDSFQNLFDIIEIPARREKYADWKPEAPPSLDGVKEVVIDFETDGLKWWAGSKPVGIAYHTPDGRSGYLPWAHKGDPNNLDEEACKRWIRTELKGKRITGAGVKTEIHMAHVINCDLEELGCEVSDVQHHAALLDDTRRRFSLEELCKEFLPDERKVLEVEGDRLEGSRMSEYPAGMVAVRAIADARQTWKLKEHFRPQLEAQDLLRVLKLEDDCNFATCEMERNGAPIDMDLLKKFKSESDEKLNRYIRTIRDEVGIAFQPSSAASWEKLFQKVAPDVLYEIERTNGGKISTKFEVLKPYADLPYVQLGLDAMKLVDLKSDFIDKFCETVTDGILRYALHQLRGDEGGTITGRFSSSAITINRERIGTNIQQIPDIRKSVDKGHDPDLLIRYLFIGGPLGPFLAADAAQIEYRLFASYARRREILEAYAKDPDLSFHKLVHAMILPYMPNLSYEHCKNINFMKLYGGGLVKLAIMMGHITEREGKQLRAEYFPKSPPRNHPKLQRAAEVDDMYARTLPEVKRMSDSMSEIATTRGYIMDLLGRRTRDYKSRPYKALNGCIQGGAGSILKHKMVVIHRNRKRLGFIPRMTVHDEVCGTAIGGVETKMKMLELLNDMSTYQEHRFPKMAVPIRWDAKVGDNWAVC
jgi:DNA polymerase I-like protein with 3'-5' exonuclease and polymerase domains